MEHVKKMGRNRLNVWNFFLFIETQFFSESIPRKNFKIIWHQCLFLYSGIFFSQSEQKQINREQILI